MKINVICPHCGSVNLLEIKPGDKKGWECGHLHPGSGCGLAFETTLDTSGKSWSTERHLLAGTGATRTVDDCIEEFESTLQ